MHFIRNYLKKTKSYSTIRFIIELTIVAILGKILLAIFPGVLIISIRNGAGIELSAPAYMDITNPFFLFFLLCIFAPIVETLIFQWLPIVLLQKVISNDEIIIAIVALIFALAHLSYGFLHMVLILPISILLAWSFILNKDDSLLKAFWITASIHALFNFSGFVPIAFL